MKPILPNRKIEGISAMLLPFTDNGTPDYDAYLAHLEKIFNAGLTPAFNMDTGYANLLTAAERAHILALMQKTAACRRAISKSCRRSSNSSTPYPDFFNLGA